eukprot:486826-Rhodomonas_salina.1
MLEAGAELEELLAILIRGWGHCVQAPGRESLLSSPVCEGPTHGNSVCSKAAQRGADKRNKQHVLLVMEATVDPIFAVDVFLELLRLVCAPLEVN